MKRALVIVAVAWVPALAGCGHPAARVGVSPESPAEVRVVTAGGAPGAPLTLPARVTAREEITVTARLAARLTALPLREGDSFRRGRVLARFDAPESRTALQAAEAGLAAASYGQDVARLQEARMESLYAARVAALREVEGARADRRVADARYAEALAMADQARAGVAIEAPFDGVVVRRHVDPGVTVGPGQPLIDVRSNAAGEIAAQVPESELARLAAGRAEFQIGDGPWRPATLARLDGMTDFATRSRVARFLAPGVALEAGAFARVRLPAAAQPAPGGGDALASQSLSVPSRALVRRGGLAGVFVVEEDRARLRWLRLGRSDAERTQVLAGLERADRVIADPAGLADGRAVKVAP